MGFKIIPGVSMTPAEHGFLFGFILAGVIWALVITFILTKIILSLISERLSDVVTFMIALVSVTLFNIIIFPGGGRIIEIVIFYIPLTITWLLFDISQKRKADKAKQAKAKEWLVQWYDADIEEPGTK
jgi:hypothetical protein